MTVSRRLLALLLPLTLGLLGLVAPSRAATLSGVLATDASDGPIAAYANTAAWSRWDDAAGGYRIVVDRGGRITTLDVAPATRPFELSAGRGPDGETWLVWTRCGGVPFAAATGCDVEGYDLGARAVRTFPFAARPGVDERAPSIDGDRVVYVAGGADAIGAVHLAGTDGSGDRVVEVMPMSTCGLSEFQECFPVTRATAIASALRGDKLAVTSRVSTSGGDFGVCGLATVRLLDLGTGAGRTLDDAVCGLSGQGMAGPAFDADRRLWWRMSCGGDPAACERTRSGPFRLTTKGRQRLVHDAGSRLLASAIAGRTPILSVRAPFSQQGCTTGPQQSAYRCATLTAIAAPRFEAVAPERRVLPPSGYVTTRTSTRLLLLKPPATMACASGDVLSQPGAKLWAGASWLRGARHTHGPAVPVTAKSRGRTVRGRVPKGASNFEGQLTTVLDLGGPSAACGRTWTLTYRPPGQRAKRFTTRVLGR